MTDTHCSCCDSASQLADKEFVAGRALGVCPVCGQKGKSVDGATIKSMLSASLRLVRDVDYFFCREAACEVVYYSGDGLQVFTTEDVRERVFQKVPDSEEVLVCYCFNHTPQSIRLELVETGESTVLDEINAGIKAGQCACDWRNPQGSCCLGNVRKVVQRITLEVNENVR